jgi:hypothetical protein
MVGVAIDARALQLTGGQQAGAGEQERKRRREQ